MSWDDTKQANDDILSADYNSMVIDQKSRIKILSVEEKTGADCSGSDGEVDRVLTLSNTVLTRQLLVFVEGRIISPSNMSITHNVNDSTIEFSNKLFDSDNIVVYPYA